jgi:hypothetical protein
MYMLFSLANQNATLDLIQRLLVLTGLVLVLLIAPLMIYERQQMKEAAR